jgi:hypothetical protein
MDRGERKTQFLTVALAWTIVAIPLAWGVFQSVVKSLPLFQPSVSSGPSQRPAPR